MKKVFIFSLLFFATASTNNIFGKLNVIYPNVNEAGKQLFGFSVLKLALENSGKSYDLNVSMHRANDLRIRALIKQKKISISDFGTSREFEQEFLPVYFPIDLGLNGWRIFLIHKDRQSLFANIKTIEELRKMGAGQGLGWSDVKILENSGLKVYQAPHINNLFKMLEAKRFDYFPLGANEVNSLFDQYRKYCPNVMVEKDILLIYPFGRLFFVHKNNKALHDAVYTGLQKSFENGSFLSLFKSHKSNSAIFTKANLKTRKQILINNPHMTNKFKKIPKKYFFNLNMLD